jgi:hypothetical protein
MLTLMSAAAWLWSHARLSQGRAGVSLIGSNSKKENPATTVPREAGFPAPVVTLAVEASGAISGFDEGVKCSM